MNILNQEIENTYNKSAISNLYNGSIGTTTTNYRDFTLNPQISYNSLNPVEEVCKILQNEIYNILSKDKQYTDEAKKIVDIIDYLKKL